MKIVEEDHGIEALVDTKVFWYDLLALSLSSKTIDERNIFILVKVTVQKCTLRYIKPDMKR